MHLHIYVISIFRDHQTHGFKINTKNNENLLKPKPQNQKQSCLYSLCLGHQQMSLFTLNPDITCFKIELRKKMKLVDNVI